jgi:hypothetical protein
MARHHGVVDSPPPTQSPAVVLGLTLRELWWPAVCAVIALVLNKVVIGDRNSFFGSVLMVGAFVGVGLAHLITYARRRQANR